MNLNISAIVILRFFELLITTVLLSVAVTALNIAGIIFSRTTLFLGTFLGTALFVFINIRRLRLCYFDVHSNFIYYSVNYAAYFIFAAVSFAIYKFCSNEVYTWMFAITKFAKYIMEFSNVESALIFHGVGLLMILLAPLGMGWIFDEETDSELI